MNAQALHSISQRLSLRPPQVESLAKLAQALEAAPGMLMAETKRRDDLGSDEVKAKTAAALRWCQHATDYATSVGGKPWRYMLIPHDEVLESKRLADFLRFEP